MPRRLGAAAAGTWLIQNPPPPPLGRGSSANRATTLAGFSASIIHEWKFEGGSSGYLLATVGGFDLEAGAGVEPSHGGPPLCFASVDSIQWAQATNSYARSQAAQDFLNTNYAFEFWFRQPFRTVALGDELIMVGARNNSNQTLGKRNDSSREYNFPCAINSFNNDLEWEHLEDILGDNAIHQLVEAHESGTRTNYIVVLDGVPIASGTNGGYIEKWDSTAGPAFNGNSGIADAYRAGGEHAYFAFYDNGATLTLQDIRELFETSSLDNQNMLEIQRWIEGDSENVTVEPFVGRIVDLADVLDSTGIRSGAIPRTVGRRVYFEIEIIDEGDSTTAVRPGIRRMITAADVGDQTTVGENGNEHHFYVDGTDLRVDRNTLVHAGATDQSTGRVYGFAIDWETGDFWVSEDGTYLQGDPITKANPSGTLDSNTAWAAHVWNNGADGNASCRLRTRLGETFYDPPTGFQHWELPQFVLENEPYGPGRRQGASNFIGCQNTYIYDFDGGLSGYLLNKSGFGEPISDDLILLGTAPLFEEPAGADDSPAEPIERLPDAAFTASTCFAGTAYEARDGRLNGAQVWCPATATVDEYLQVDLLEVKTITAVSTQGDPSIAEWTTTYDVQISTDGINFSGIAENTLTGNTDQNSVVTNSIGPYEARYVRFLVKTWSSFPCLRIDVTVALPQLSYASEDSVRFEAGNNDMRNADHNDADVHAFELHWKQPFYTGQSQAVLMSYTSNAHFNVGNKTGTGNMPCVHNNFNAVTSWESVVDVYGDNKPHQLIEACDPDAINNGVAILDGMPVDVFTGVSSWCSVIQSGSTSMRFNGNGNDTDADRSLAYFGYHQEYRGGDQISLFEARRIYEAGSIFWDKIVEAGMRDGTILDAQITASSENVSNPATDGRLYDTGSWRPNPDAVGEYLQVDFGEEVWVRAVVLQGIPGSTFAVSSFSLDYSNDDISYTQYNSGEILNGIPTGVNGDTAIQIPVITFKCRYIRFVVEGWTSAPTVRLEYLINRDTPRSRDMLTAPRWYEGDQVNCTVGGTGDKDLTCGDVTDDTGGRSGAIPRNGKVYFEVEIVAQGDDTASNLLGIRKLAEPSNVGFDPATATDEYHTDGAGDVEDGQDNSLGITGSLGTAATGRIFQFAIDWDTGDWWMGTDNTLWAGVGGAGDPSLGNNPLDAIDTDFNWAVVNRVNGTQGNGQVRLITASVDLNYTPPTNYRAWEDAIF